MQDIYYANHCGHISGRRRTLQAAAAAAHLVVLVGRHRHELSLWEHVGSEGAVGQLQDVVGPHYVEPGLVLVHGVQDGLDQHTQRSTALA